MKESQTLLLLRHARAQPWSPGLSDLERPLDDHGRNHMGQLATWAEKHLDPPDTVLCSPARRTRQTLEPLTSQWIAQGSEIRIEEDIYEATTGRLQSLVENAFQTAKRLLVIGHNPGLEYLAHLISGSMMDEKSGRMTMGAMVVIEFPGGWHRDRGKGRLRYWLGSDAFS